MPETRPISKRIDLTYVKKRAWPQQTIWVASLALAGVFLAGAVGVELAARAPGLYAHSVYSSGTISKSHAMFADNCLACHQSAPAKPGEAVQAGFWLPVQDQACLACHETTAATHTPSHQFAGWPYQGPPRNLPGAGEVRMSGSCVACHVEHRGYHANLNDVPDSACVQCHQSLDAYASKLNTPQTPNAKSSAAPGPAPSAPAAPATKPAQTGGQS